MAVICVPLCAADCTLPTSSHFADNVGIVWASFLVAPQPLKEGWGVSCSQGQAHCTHDPCSKFMSIQLVHQRTMACVAKDRQYYLLGGKGGVGKTQHSSRTRSQAGHVRRTHACSLHRSCPTSLSDSLDQVQSPRLELLIGWICLYLQNLYFSLIWTVDSVDVV